MTSHYELAQQLRSLGFSLYADQDNNSRSEIGLGDHNQIGEINGDADASVTWDAGELMSALDSAGFPSDQDWDAGATIWTIGEVKIRIEGTEVTVG